MIIQYRSKGFSKDKDLRKDFIMFMSKVSYVQQGCIYYVKNTVKM